MPEVTADGAEDLNSDVDGVDMMLTAWKRIARQLVLLAELPC